MTLVALHLALLASRAREAGPGVEDFKGFIPRAETAVAVARPILLAMLGERYLALAEPLVASRLHGYWLVRGRGRRRPCEDRNVEPFFLALDPWSGRVALFGVYGRTSFDSLRRRPPDVPHRPRRRR